MFFCQLLHNLYRRAFAEVVDVRLVRQAQTGDHGIAETCGKLFDLVDYLKRLGVIGLTRDANQTALGRSTMHDKPRVNRYAVAAHPGTRLEDIHTGMPVRDADELPYIDVKSVGDN